MPQMDDKIGVYFGRIDPAVWDRIADQPGATVEKAVAALDKARSSGRTIHYPTALKIGIRKKLWLTPETVETLKKIRDETGAPNTPIILAALDLYLGAVPSGGSPGARTKQEPTPPE